MDHLTQVTHTVQATEASHPPCDDGVDVSGVTCAQGHEVSVERSDPLQPQSDETSRREVQEFRGQIISPGSAVDQRGVDLRRRKGEKDQREPETDTRLTSPCSRGFSLE